MTQPSGSKINSDLLRPLLNTSWRFFLLVAIFGGIDDKREQISNTPDKVLVLKGFTMFGGIEIKSY